MEEWLKNFIKASENYIEVAKILDGETYPTIGYGIYHKYPDGTPIKVGDTITKEEAEKMMVLYVKNIMPEVYKYFPEFDQLPDLMKGAIIDMAYRGGGVAFGKSPAFVAAVNNGQSDGHFTDDELAKIVKETDIYKEKSVNLRDRKQRRAAMIYGIYNNDHNSSIRSLGGKYNKVKSTEYTDFDQLVNTPGSMWNMVYRSTKSPANFILRLWDPKKEYVKDWEHGGYTSTHKLGYVGEGDYEVVYPTVQYTDYPWYRFDKPNDGLHDFSDPKYKMDWKDIYKLAIELGDTLHVPKGSGEAFTTLYKNYYPGFKKTGGTINYIKMFLIPSGPIEKYPMDYIDIINNYADTNFLTEELKQELFKYDGEEIEQAWGNEYEQKLIDKNVNYIETLFPKNPEIVLTYKDYIKVNSSDYFDSDLGEVLNGHLRPLSFLHDYYNRNPKYRKLIDKSLSKHIPGYLKKSIGYLSYNTDNVNNYFKLNHPSSSLMRNELMNFQTNLRMSDPKYNDVKAFYEKQIKPVYDAKEYTHSYYTSDGYKDKLDKAQLPYNPIDFSLVQVVGGKISALSENSPVTGIKIGIKPTENIPEEYLGFILLGKLDTHLPDGTTVHEIAHDNPLWNTRTGNGPTEESPEYGMDYSQIPQQWKNILLNYKEGVDPKNAHDAELNEHYSDLLELRYYLYKYGIADLRDPNVVITADMIQRLLSEHPELLDVIRFLRYHDINTSVDALNNIAANYTYLGVNYAKRGTKLRKTNLFKNGETINYLSVID